MSLDWNVGDVKDHDTVCFETRETGRGDIEVNEDGTPARYLKPKTEALIWMTMGIKMGQITEKTCEEFYARTSLTQRHDGVPQEYRITYEDVRAHIGLSTNVHKDTWAQFLKGFRQQAERSAANARRKFENEAV